MLGATAMARHMEEDIVRRRKATWPDIHVEHLNASELTRYGFTLTGREPTSWSDISLSLAQNEQGSVTFLRCTITAGEVDRLLAWPPGSRRPCDQKPPSDWPRESPGHRLAMPEWWQPGAGRSRYSEKFDEHGGAGLFAQYDDATSILHLWQWQRQSWTPSRVSLPSTAVADAFAMALFPALQRLGAVVQADGWISVENVSAGTLGLMSAVLPAGVTHISASLLPIKNRHRYLLALSGMSEEHALQLVSEQPLVALKDDSVPPTDVWQDAQTPGGLPAWFTPGAGPRRAHCLTRIGSGLVEAGRWIAYDRMHHVLYVWDWEDQIPMSPIADLCSGR